MGLLVMWQRRVCGHRQGQRSLPAIKTATFTRIFTTYQPGLLVFNSSHDKQRRDQADAAAIVAFLAGVYESNV